MELSVREWMIIIGVLLIVAVLLDGYRRVRNERRHRIKVSLSRQAYKQAFIPSREPQAVDEKERGPNPELPNGGARVIGRRGHDLQLDQPVPVLLESVGMPAPQPEETEPETAAPESFDDEPHMAAPVEEPRWDEVLDESPAEPAEVQRREIDYGEEAPAAWEDDIPEPACAAEAPLAGRGALYDRDAPAKEVLVIYVIARDRGTFKGQDLLQILLACDLRFGGMNIFHRHEKANGRGAVQFSVANLVEPGTFDLDRIEEFSTPGVCLFLSLPGPEAPYKAFDYMVETANVLVKHLNGELRDEAHSAMTQQTLEHCRQRIRDFERKQLTLHL
jgi:cell division protein ZipA